MALPSPSGMFGKAKEYFSFLARHWLLSVLLVFTVALFLSPWLYRIYSAVQARVPFLPNPKYGEV